MKSIKNIGRVFNSPRQEDPQRQHIDALFNAMQGGVNDLCKNSQKQVLGTRR